MNSGLGTNRIDLGVNQLGTNVLGEESTMVTIETSHRLKRATRRLGLTRIETKELHFSCRM